MQALATRTVVMAAAFLIAAVFFVATGVFVSLALYQGLLLIAIAPLAALLTAVISFLFALIILAIGVSMANAMEKRARAKRGPASAEIGLELGRILGEQVTRYAGDNPLRVLIGAMVTGLAIGVFPSLRGILMRFFRPK